MQITTIRGSVLVTVLILAVSANAKTIEKREDKPDYFENAINKIDDLKTLPFIGGVVGPYINMIQHALRSINKSTDGDLSDVFNSVMPCDLKGPILECEGNLDQEKVRNLIKKLLTLIPTNSLPPTVVSSLKLVSDMI